LIEASVKSRQVAGQRIASGDASSESMVEIDFANQLPLQATNSIAPAAKVDLRRGSRRIVGWRLPRPATH
jgi:hypothetical protein